MISITIETIVDDIHLGRGGIFARVRIPDPEYPDAKGDRITVRGEGLKLGQEISITIEAHND